MRVFLTGVSGYLGGVLAEHIARMPEVTDITGVDVSNPVAPLPGKVKFRQMDVRSGEVAAAMAQHDVVVNTASIVLWSARMPASTRDDINLNGTRNLAQAAVRQGVRRFVHTSSMAAYDPHRAKGQSQVTEDFPLGGDDGFFYYWSSKAAAERILTGVLGTAGVLLTMLRPIYIIGPRNRATVKGLRENAINFPGCDPRRQFVHEDDVAAAFVQALRAELPGPYNVTPDDFLRMSEVWQIVGAKKVLTVPLWLARMITAMRWRFLGSPIHASWVEDILVDFTGSNSKLKSAGWKPAYNSAAALRAAL